LYIFPNPVRPGAEVYLEEDSACSVDSGTRRNSPVADAKESRAESSEEDIEQSFPTHDEIEKRAYQLYLERGQDGSHAIEDWFNAEDELRQEYANRKAASQKNKATTIAGPVAPRSNRTAHA
jgi:hypothetical protein